MDIASLYIFAVPPKHLSQKLLYVDIKLSHLNDGAHQEEDVETKKHPQHNVSLSHDFVHVHSSDNR